MRKKVVVMDLKYLVNIVDSQLTKLCDATRDYSDRELRILIEKCTQKIGQKVPLSILERNQIMEEVFNTRRKLGIIQPLLEDSSINEIMINGTNNIYIEKGGNIEETELRFDNRDKLLNMIQGMVSKVNRTVNESMPIVDARLEDGSRLNVVLPPVSLDGAIVTIRKFSPNIFNLQNLVELGTLSEKEKYFLERAVRNKANIFISGGTSTGKTTFLNALSGCIGLNERVITIEDSAELRLGIKNLIRLETRNPNTEDKGKITMRQLIKSALRMRPDRIIIGEVRDEAALDMLNALCTGHEGSMSTGHANSARDMLLRLETMAMWEGHMSCEAVRRQIASGINLIVHLKRDESMNRKADEILEICSYSDGGFILNTLYEQGKAVNEPKTEKLKEVL
ncbi:MAG: CpaF family protein [Clostridiales bacterium]|jgi:pilus assembly protein CpaF|nr:CpaF family protein [Clostridiales bacterium]